MVKAVQMKRIIVLVFGLLLAGAGNAQVLGGFFNQNSTRKTDNEEQISVLQAFITVAEKGYSIVESGLSTIKGIKTGEFNLHSTFYASLESINPAVGNMGEVAEIVALQLATAERVNAALARYRQSGSMGADDMTVIGQAFQTVVNAGTADINTLIQIITASQLQMTDDQRMERIRELDAAGKARYELAAGFTDEADMLSLQRQAEVAQIATLQGLYGVP